MFINIFEIYLLFVIYSFKPSFAADSTNMLTVNDSHHHICSATNFCSKIDTFSVTNDPFSIEPNRKSDVKIFFKSPTSCANSVLQDTYGYLSTHGGVSTTESQIPDIRRTKV
jgi:hypothetical protein